MTDILGIGNALIDIISFVETDFPATLGLKAGSMNHVPYERVEDIILALPDPIFCAGGAAANTVKLAGRLRLKTAFLGAVGTDRFGNLFAEELGESVATLSLVHGTRPTGICINLIEPHETKTVVTVPGPRLTATRDLPDSLFEGVRLLYVEGHLLQTPAVFDRAVERARKKGVPFCVSAGHPALAATGRERLLACAAMPECRVVFANEEEFSALFDKPQEEAIPAAAEYPAAFAVMRGGQGAFVVHDTAVTKVPALHKPVTDRTGSGDAFVAGYLTGLLRQEPVRCCARRGIRAAAIVLQVPGTRLTARQKKILAIQSLSRW